MESVLLILFLCYEYENIILGIVIISHSSPAGLNRTTLCSCPWNRSPSSITLLWSIFLFSDCNSKLLLICEGIVQKTSEGKSILHLSLPFIRASQSIESMKVSVGKRQVALSWVASGLLALLRRQLCAGCNVLTENVLLWHERRKDAL